MKKVLIVGIGVALVYWLVTKGSTKVGASPIVVWNPFTGCPAGTYQSGLFCKPGNGTSTAGGSGGSTNGTYNVGSGADPTDCLWTGTCK